MNKQRGFTLIELLVVIAIIGLLSTMAVVSLNSARGKARDAKRVSDVKQLSNVIEMAAANTSSGSYKAILPGACQAVGKKTTDCGTNFEGINWTIITDPSGTSACVNASAAVCAYAFTVNNSNNDDYEICFYLERGAGGIESGSNSIGPGGVITNTCSG